MIDSNSKLRAITLDEIIRWKLRQEGGKLFDYLDQIEGVIQQSISAYKLSSHYGVIMKGKNRCACPFENSGSYNSAFSFSDQLRSFKCFAHGESGTYLEFIAKIEGYKSNVINEAKIFAASHFAGIELGFNSIADHDSQLESLIRKEYRSTGSLIFKHYKHISLLNNGNIRTKSSLKYSILEKDRLPIKKMNHNAHTNTENYLKSLMCAEKSLLVKTLESAPELNSVEVLEKLMLLKYDISIETALAFGLVLFEKKNQSRLPYPQFHFINSRILVPYRDHITKKTVGYTARAMGLRETPKYINIADFGEKVGENYDKNYFRPFLISNFLFNLDRLIGKKIDNLFIVEGPIDAIKMTALGYNCVALGGVYLLDQHISLIEKHFGTELNINLLFDSDPSQIGHINSKTARNKLIAVGFKNVKDVHLNGILGKDITEMAVNIRDDVRLRIIIDDSVIATKKIQLSDAAEDYDSRILKATDESQKRRNLLSEKQLMILKRRFSDNEIDIIVRGCSKGKIAMLIGKIIRNEAISEREYMSLSDN